MAQMVKDPPTIQETWVRSLGWEDPLEKGMVTTAVLLPGEFHGQRSLAGYRPYGCKDPDMTERLTHMHTHTLKVSALFHSIVSGNGVIIFILLCITDLFPFKIGFEQFHYDVSHYNFLHIYIWDSLSFWTCEFIFFTNVGKLLPTS